MNPFALLPFLFALQTITIHGADDVLTGKYRIDISVRPETIYPPITNYNAKLTKQGFGRDYQVAVSRHHIIPFNLLRDFYNKLIKNGETGKLKSFWTKFGDKFTEYYRRRGIEEGKPNKYETTIANVKKIILGLYWSKLIQDAGARRPESLDEFLGYYTWLPGNLFIGPNKRSDDPAEGFEKNSQTIVGSRRFDNLKDVYSLMSSYVAGKTIDFDKLSNGLRDIANLQDPQALKNADWVLNQDGSYKIKI